MSPHCQRPGATGRGHRPSPPINKAETPRPRGYKCWPRGLRAPAPSASPLELHRQTDRRAPHDPHHPSARGALPSLAGTGTASHSPGAGDSLPIPLRRGHPAVSWPVPSIPGTQRDVCGDGNVAGGPKPLVAWGQVSEGNGQRHWVVTVGAIGCSGDKGTPVTARSPTYWPCPRGV